MFCHSIRLFCVWASRRQESLCSILVRHCGTIRGRLFNRGLVPKSARFLVLVWLIFFKHGAQSCGFSGLASGCVFRARFWARFIDARVPIFGPKMWTPSRGEKHNSDSNYFVSAPSATSCAGALERFHECLLTAKNAARSSHAFKKNEVKQQADMRPSRRGGCSSAISSVSAISSDSISILSGILSGVSFDILCGILSVMS